MQTPLQEEGEPLKETPLLLRKTLKQAQECPDTQQAQSPDR
jgi:hypothetical protein